MIADVGLLLLLYLVVFGVVGVQLYAGRLDGRCAQPDFSDAVTDAAGLVTGVRYVVDSSRSGEVCAGPSALHTTWYNSSSRRLHADSPHPPSGMTCPPASSEAPWGYFCSPTVGGMRNFDTILAAWLAVFQSLTATDWAFIMYDCQDALSWWVWPLHFAMVILGALFLVNLALAVLYLFFSKERAAPALALVWYGMPAAVAQATSWANYAFTAYFVAELASKLCGLGLRAYVQDGMNVFDALVTVAGAVDVALELSPAAGALGSYLLVLRAFRLLR
ncbi:uncharacterized protein HaLaN_06866, partial [Haematococcus lacustris]